MSPRPLTKIQKTVLEVLAKEPLSFTPLWAAVRHRAPLATFREVDRALQGLRRRGLVGLLKRQRGIRSFDEWFPVTPDADGAR